MEEGCFEYLKDELEEFLEERVKDILLPETGDHPAQQIAQPNDYIVINSITEVVEWAITVKRNNGLFKVNY